MIPTDLCYPCGGLAKDFTPDDLPDLSGKVMVVTGGNSGIGFAAVQHLVRRGAKVYLAARNEQRAQAALARLEAEGLGTGQVEWHCLDLSDPRLAKQSAEALLAKEDRLDVVINCAGLMLVPYAVTTDGIQDVVMVNYVSPKVFVGGLLPLMKKTASEPSSDVRIVTVLSEGFRYVPSDVRFRSLDDLNAEYKGTWFAENRRYNLSKYMAMLQTKELQRRLDAESAHILVMAVHPGFVNSEGVQAYARSAGPILAPIYAAIPRLFFVSSSEGSYSSLYAACSPDVRAEPAKCAGAYFIPPGKLGTVPAQAEDPELGEELWDTTERILEELHI